MNTTEFLKAVDHAASMNDRWLFLAAFCLLLLLCGVVIYWLVRQLQLVIADHKELRREHHAALEKGPRVTPAELLAIVSSHRGEPGDFDTMRPDLRLQA